MREIPAILQLDVSGTPQQWITFQNSCYYYSKGNVARSMGTHDIDIYGGTCAATGARSVLTINTIIAIKGKPSPKSMKHYNRVPLTNITLFRRDQNMCGYCGGVFSKSQLTRDHVHPVSKGGKNIWTNVITSCAPCNKRKDAHLLKDIDMDLMMIPYAPNRSEWLILQNRNLLADQMDFLMKGVPKISRLHEYADNYGSNFEEV